MSRTVVYQSYRTENVPPAITRCMDSVRGWADAKGYDYRFYDDAFLAKVPRWLSDVTANILLTTDYARVMTALELHDKGFDRAIWMDADLAVFAPEVLELPSQKGFGFSREWWFNKRGDDYIIDRRVNNCCCYFDRGDPFAPFYLQAMERRLQQRGDRITNLEFSTTPLTEMHKSLPFSLTEQVATLSPLAARLVVNKKEDAVREQMKAYGGPLAAVHLALSLTDVDAQKVLDLAFARDWPFDGSF